MYMNWRGNWLSVAENGNPADGLYVALYNGPDDNLIVALVEYNDESCGHADGYGWGELVSNEEDFDWTSRDVVAYLPDDLGLAALRQVRQRFQ